MTIPEIVAVLFAAVSVVINLVNAIVKRDDTAAGAWSQMLAPLRAENKELHARVDTLESEMVKLQVQNGVFSRIVSEHEAGIVRLTAQVVSLGANPVYTLPKLKT